VQSYFGKLKEEDDGPDFPGARTELKATPLERRSKQMPGFQAAQRITITDVNRSILPGETWPRSRAWEKLQNLLVVFYIRRTGRAQSIVREAELWSPGEREQGILKSDWSTVQEKITLNSKTELHEGDGYVLGPAPHGGRGEGSTPTRQGPKGFAVQHWFSKQLYDWVMARAIERATSDLELAQGPYARLERVILGSLRRYESRSIGSLAREFGITSRPKHAASLVLRHAVSSDLFEREWLELKRTGVQLRVLGIVEGRSRPEEGLPLSPVEMDTFRAGRWEDSSLYRDIHHIIFVPTYIPQAQAAVRGARDQYLRVVGKAFLWKPLDEDLRRMKADWEKLRAAEGRGEFVYAIPSKGEKGERDLPGPSHMDCIHIRGKDQDQRHAEWQDDTHYVYPWYYWLVEQFLEELVKRHDGG
jgi:DNA mismatch repair protein MutH